MRFPGVNQVMSRSRVKERASPQRLGDALLGDSFSEVQLANQCPLFHCDHASNLSDWSGSVFDRCYWLSFRPALTPQMPPGPPQLWGTAPAGELRHLGRISPNPVVQVLGQPAGRSAWGDLGYFGPRGSPQHCPTGTSPQAENRNPTYVRSTMRKNVVRGGTWPRVPRS